MKRILLHITLILIIFLIGCNLTEKVRNGDMAFERKQYAVAVAYYLSEIDKISNPEIRAEKSYKLGLAFEKVNDPGRAAFWFDRARKDGYGDDALLKLASSLKKMEAYDQSAEIFRTLADQNGRADLTREYYICQQAKQWKENSPSSPYIIKPTSYSSPGDDYGTMITSDGTIVFCSDRADSEGTELYKRTLRKYTDLYQFKDKQSGISTFQLIENTEAHEGTFSMSPNGKNLVFTRCDTEEGEDVYCKLYHTALNDDSWSKEIPLPFQKENVNYLHPAFLNDSTLIFSSTAERGYGGYDLFITQLNSSKWAFPVILSNRVNSAGNELFPTINRDTLYFSSDWFPGMGGLDVFKTFRDENSRWSIPINMESPINSGGDDFHYIITRYPSKKNTSFEGYISSSRKGGQGGDDIYKFFHKALPPPDPADTMIQTREGSMILDVYTYWEDEDGNQSPVPNTLVSMLSINGYSRDFTKSDGHVEFDIYKGNSYQLQFEGEGYFIVYEDFKAPNTPIPEGQTVRILRKVRLDRLVAGEEIVLENIYYDFDKWHLREDALPELDKLVNILRNNPGILIQLFSHTDCRGTDKYNLELSQKRAISAVEYLIEKGISSDRLIAIGKGEGSPLIQCYCEECTEEEHQENRRTSFLILEN